MNCSTKKSFLFEAFLEVRKDIHILLFEEVQHINKDPVFFKFFAFTSVDIDNPKFTEFVTWGEAHKPS